MKYILITDVNNKVMIFEENNRDLLYKFLKENLIDIDSRNYFTEDEFKKFMFYRRISNYNKTDEEFMEYVSMAKRVGIPKPETSLPNS